MSKNKVPEYVATTTTFENVEYMLVSKISNGKWYTDLSIGGKKIHTVEHKAPMNVKDQARDSALAKQAKIEIGKGANEKFLKPIYQMIEKFGACTTDINAMDSHDIAICHEYAEVESEKKVQANEEHRAKLITTLEGKEFEKQRLHAILCNASGNNTMDEITKAQEQLLQLMLPDMWYIHGVSKTSMGHVVLQKLVIAEYIHRAYNTISFGGKVWRYDWQRAFYVYDYNDEVLEAAVRKIFTYVGDSLNGYIYNGNFESDINNILGQAAGYKMYTHNPFNKQKNVVNTRSGVLLMDYKNKKIIPLGKKPENMFSYCVDCEYNPDADATEIDNIYRNVVGHQQIDIIYQIPALALIHTDIELTPTKIAYIFLGKSNTGKSIVQTGYAKLFGTETVSKISMHEIVNNKFVKPMLEGKLLNLDDELPEALQSAETREIKSITGIKEHTLEPKNQKPYNGIISCILIFAGNQLPKLTVSKDAKAFWERFDIVSFNTVFPTNDEFINQTFTENNKSAMLNKVLEKMFEIKDSTGSKCNIKRCIPKENIFDVWQKSSSTVYQCIMDITFPSNEIEMYEKRKLFQIYENWCDSNNIPFDDSHRIWSLDEMGRTLNNLSLAKNVHHEQGASGRYWLMRRGLKLEWYLPEDKAALGSFMSENLEQYINEAEEFSEEFS